MGIVRRSGRIRPKPSERRTIEDGLLESSRGYVYGRSGYRCEVCGGVGREYSHRRTRAVGGEHQHCPCNALLACSADHRRMHSSPVAARANGWHVSRYVDEPGSVPVWLPPRGGWFLLGCDGSMTRTEAPDDPDA